MLRVVPYPEGGRKRFSGPLAGACGPRNGMVGRGLFLLWAVGGWCRCGVVLVWEISMRYIFRYIKVEYSNKCVGI